MPGLLAALSEIYTSKNPLKILALPFLVYPIALFLGVIPATVAAISTTLAVHATRHTTLFISASKDFFPFVMLGIFYGALAAMPTYIAFYGLIDDRTKTGLDINGFFLTCFAPCIVSAFILFWVIYEKYFDARNAMDETGADDDT